MAWFKLRGGGVARNVAGARLVGHIRSSQRFILEGSMTVSEPFFSPRSGTNPPLTGYGVQKRYTRETVWAADTSKL